VAELRPHVPELRTIGVEPYVIGSGSPAQAQQFQQKMKVETLPVLSDQRLESYRAAGFKRSAVATMLHPSTWARGLKIALKYRQGRTLGDPWQLGGAMIVRPDGELRWRFVSAAGGHHPSLAQLLDEARRAVT
jgi:hypothetical protein